jgi:hypothetical protein
MQKKYQVSGVWRTGIPQRMRRNQEMRQLNPIDAEELSSRIVGAFYARHPEVLKAINRDAGGLGVLTQKTKKMVRAALDHDAALALSSHQSATQG